MVDLIDVHPSLPLLLISCPIHDGIVLEGIMIGPLMENRMKVKNNKKDEKDVFTNYLHYHLFPIFLVYFVYWDPHQVCDNVLEVPFTNTS